MQATLDVAAMLGENVPDAHAVHCETCDAPDEDEYEPALQLVHWLIEVALTIVLYRPATQSVHVADPATDDHEPASQLTHVLLT